MVKKKSLALAAFIMLFSLSSAPAEDKEGLPKLLVFESPVCGSCIEAKKGLLPAIEEEYKERVILEYYDVTDIKNYKFLIGLREKYGPDVEISLPVFFMRGSFLNGKSDLNKTLRVFIEGSLAGPGDKLNGIGIDLIGYFKGIRPLVILGAGLIDGINPCAFTAIVFFISFLVLQGYRKRELIAIGASFIAAVFITYILIGLGAFNFLYHLRGFWIFARAFNLAVGIFSISLGLLAVYDFIKFRKTKDTQGLILQLPKLMKDRVHSIIGAHYRKAKEERDGIGKRPLFRLALSALVTGFLVSILEAVCTGQLYLPTIAFVLKTTPLKLQAFWYLIIYNIMFILPLLAVFIMGLFGVTSGQFSAFLKRHLGGVKITMAFVFFSLGVFLIWRG